MNMFKEKLVFQDTNQFEETSLPPQKLDIRKRLIELKHREEVNHQKINQLEQSNLKEKKKIKAEIGLKLKNMDLDKDLTFEDMGLETRADMQLVNIGIEEKIRLVDTKLIDVDVKEKTLDIGLETETRFINSKDIEAKFRMIFEDKNLSFEKTIIEIGQNWPKNNIMSPEFGNHIADFLIYIYKNNKIELETTSLTFSFIFKKLIKQEFIKNTKYINDIFEISFDLAHKNYDRNYNVFNTAKNSQESTLMNIQINALKTIAFIFNNYPNYIFKNDRFIIEIVEIINTIPNDLYTNDEKINILNGLANNCENKNLKEAIGQQIKTKTDIFKLSSQEIDKHTNMRFGK